MPLENVNLPALQNWAHRFLNFWKRDGIHFQWCPILVEIGTAPTVCTRLDDRVYRRDILSGTI